LRYDSYNKERLYKPGLTIKCRDRLHRLTLSGLDIRSLCEIGVGFGELASYCRKNEINWIGIEPNDKLREDLIDDGFKVYNGMMPEFPEIEEKYDAIFASHFIEHLNNLQEVTSFLNNCRENLGSHNGRYLILLYPDIEKCGSIFWHDYTHSFVTTKKRIEDLLYDLGWKIRRSDRYTACFFRGSSFISFIGKIFPHFLLPKKVAFFTRLSFLQHVLTIAEPE
jgi:cyclopropane fatty-acyl-phospholipid synthase-like methyltransferase